MDELAWEQYKRAHGLHPDTKYTQVFPFAHNVHIDDVNGIQVLRDMPWPQNMNVHICNEHGSYPDDWRDNQHQHLLAHAYGKFREGAEHFHTRDVR